jgi:hypothetical protein
LTFNLVGSNTRQAAANYYRKTNATPSISTYD